MGEAVVKCSQPGGDLQEEGCYLPSFGCNGGSIGPHVCVPRGDGSRERIVTERGEERGGRASLKHLGSQTAALEEGRDGAQPGQGSALRGGQPLVGEHRAVPTSPWMERGRDSPHCALCPRGWDEDGDRMGKVTAVLNVSRDGVRMGTATHIPVDRDEDGGRMGTVTAVLHVPMSPPMG